MDNSFPNLDPSSLTESNTPKWRWWRSLPLVAAAALEGTAPPTTPAETLRLLIRLFEQPNHWIRDQFARDNFGHVVSPDDTSACCWCVDGALILLTCPNIHTWTKLYWDTDNLMVSLCGESVPTWQDQHSHDEVLAMLRQALALVEVTE